MNYGQTVRVYDMAKGSRTIQEAGKFLMKRGLSRDKANYVELLVRWRQDMQAMVRVAKDEDVLSGLDGMIEILGDEIMTMYDLQQERDGGKHGG